jgi:molecular chaperone GrpE
MEETRATSDGTDESHAVLAATSEVVAPEADGPSALDPLDHVLQRLSQVEAQLAEFNRRSAHREGVIDHLHAENQELRAGLRRSILEPAVADLIRLHDGLGREAARLPETDVATLLRSFGADVELTLDRCGLEAFTAETGEPYRRGEHRALAVIPVADPEWDDRVADVVAVGFRDRETGRIRRPLVARFYQYRAPQPEAPATVEPSGDD